jgi:transcriptional regulator with PAS, ATPase and Fis domain
MSIARRAEEAINKIGEHVELGALYRSYGQIHSHNGEPEAARDFFNKSVRLLSDIGARYELALSHLACGESGSYNLDKRIRHLDAARLLFTEMEVPGRVRQVDEAVVSLKPRSVPALPAGGSGNGAPTIIFVNSKMKRIIAYAENVAQSDLSILLTGETGTGKDLLAHRIHQKSCRTGEFVSLNAAAIPNEMIESELFGFRKGAFTGASKDKPGLIEAAENGTLYLNEIAEATPEFQVKLLEVLESPTLRRLGENRSRPVNFRLIAACNSDLLERVESGLFRRDLYYRLQKIPIHLPPLRDRVDDIAPLVRHFLSEAGFSNGDLEDPRLRPLLRQLEADTWPGNVRELKSVISRLATLAPQRRIEELLEALDQSGLTILRGRRAVSQRERLADALRRSDGNRAKAARELGIPESTLRYQIKKYGLI